MEQPNHEVIYDTNQQQLGDIYAKALMGFGLKTNSVDQLVDELGGVVNAINDLPNFKQALESPRIAANDKAAMIDKAFSGKVSKNLVNFLKILAHRDRFECLNALLASARKTHDQMAGRVEATVTTAEPIDDSTKTKLSEKLSKAMGKSVHLTSSVDPSIIGGMVVRVGDTVYDGSVVSQLARVRSQAVKRATDAIRSSIDMFTSS